MERPITTLFMLMSVDGKISTGVTDERDVDRDFPRIEGVKDGLKQYYEIEQETDLFSLGSGKVMAKVGANIKKEIIEESPVSFIVIDNKPYLTDIGVDYLIKRAKVLYLVTKNKNHPIFKYEKTAKVKIVYYENEIDFGDLFRQLKVQYGIEKMTIQTGGTLNAVLLREKLIDRISIVVAPVLIGGKETPTLIDGETIETLADLKKAKALKLTELIKLDNSYINLKYEVVKETKLV
jgi:2,5-diamino-6-(ribosylamino)-4(3H)-pyrimidinone 5'-phosphate reductase